MAVDALDLDGVSRLALEPPVAVHVLLEVTVDAMHALLEVDVLQVHGDAGAAVRAAFDGRLEGHLSVLRRDVRDDVAAGVEQAALAVVLEDRAEHPPVPVEVGELREVHAGVRVGGTSEEVGSGDLSRMANGLGIEIRPQPSHRRRLGVPLQARKFLRRCRMDLLARVHEGAVRLVVPPHVPEVLVRVGGARVHVAHDALARRDRPREDVSDRMAWLSVRDRRIGRRRGAAVTVLGIGPGVERVAVVRVDDVACRAAARAVVAGIVVRAKERQHRVEQARSLETLKDGIGAVDGAKPTNAQPVVAPLEDAQHVARLRDLEVRQRIEEGEDAEAACLLGGGRRDGLQALRRAVVGVALSEACILQREGPVVVESGTPQHRAVGHHARSHARDLRRVTARRAARGIRDPEVTRVEEPDELRALVIQRRVRARRVCRRGPAHGVSRQDVDPPLRCLVDLISWRRAGGARLLRGPTVAVHASEPHRL